MSEVVACPAALFSGLPSISTRDGLVLLDWNGHQASLSPDQAHQLSDLLFAASLRLEADHAKTGPDPNRTLAEASSGPYASHIPGGVDQPESPAAFNGRHCL